MRIQFNKPYMHPDDMVKLLQQRGLEIDNPQIASLHLLNIGYYRLSAYMYPFLRQPKEEHHFKYGSKFRDAFNRKH
ncbi:MAG: Abi family protein [Lepagella sp.]